MKNATSTDSAVDCPFQNCGCHYHAEDGTLADYTPDESQFRATSGFHRDDDFLRECQPPFEIASRPNHGPAGWRWKRNGELYNHDQAMAIADATAEREVEAIVSGDAA